MESIQRGSTPMRLYFGLPENSESLVLHIIRVASTVVPFFLSFVRGKKFAEGKLLPSPLLVGVVSTSISLRVH